MPQITSPDEPQLDELCRLLSAQADALDLSGAWPRESLALCRQYGVYRWFAPRSWEGLGWSEPELLRGYIRLASACLSTTFVLTQPHGVIRRLLDADNEALQATVLPGLVRGERFASVGIAHLTTSRRHLSQPVLRARQVADSFVLDGLCPWVTGGVESDWVLTGAQLPDARQLLVVLPTDGPGVAFDPPAEMVGLTATQTGSMRCHGVRVEPAWVLAGPCENVMNTQRGGKTGSLQTSALALGLSLSAIDFLAAEAAQRAELATVVDSLRGEHAAITTELLRAAAGIEGCVTNDELRARANLLALRSTQSALTAAKGAGYRQGHPVGRWCREALFFLVWSCPQGVASATLCELAGLS